MENILQEDCCPFCKCPLIVDRSSNFKIEKSCPKKVDHLHDESHYHIRKYDDGFLQQVCIIKPYIIENFCHKNSSSSIYKIIDDEDYSYPNFNGDEIYYANFNIDLFCGDEIKILNKIEKILIFK